MVTINEKEDKVKGLENLVSEEIENNDVMNGQKPEFDTFGTALNEL